MSNQQAYAHLQREYTRKYPKIAYTKACGVQTTATACARTKRATNMNCTWDTRSRACTSDETQLKTMVAKIRQQLHVPDVAFAYMYANLGKIPNDDTETAEKVHALPMYQQALLVVYFYELETRTNVPTTQFLSGLSDVMQTELANILRDETEPWTTKIANIDALVQRKLKSRSKTPTKSTSYRWPGWAKLATLFALVGSAAAGEAAAGGVANHQLEILQRGKHAVMAAHDNMPTEADVFAERMDQFADEHVKQWEWNKFEEDWQDHNQVVRGAVHMIRRFWNTPEDVQPFKEESVHVDIVERVFDERLWSVDMNNVHVQQQLEDIVTAKAAFDAALGVHMPHAVFIEKIARFPVDAGLLHKHYEREHAGMARVLRERQAGQKVSEDMRKKLDDAHKELADARAELAKAKEDLEISYERIQWLEQRVDTLEKQCADLTKITQKNGVDFILWRYQNTIAVSAVVLLLAAWWKYNRSTQTNTVASTMASDALDEDVVAEAHVPPPYFSTTSLEKAVKENATSSNGGMNLDELRKVCAQYNILCEGSRADITQRLAAYFKWG